MAIGLINTSNLYRQPLSDLEVAVLAALGVEARYRRPLHPEGTVYVETTLEEIRRSRWRPEEEIMSISDRVVNQDDLLLIEMRRHWRVGRPGHRRPGGENT